MADNTAIEWTDATWNPITGCSVVSPGCTNCYAMRLAGTRLKHHPSRKGLTRDSKAGPVWTGEVRFNEAELLKPLSWKRPRKIFVCAHGDLFHEDVPDDWIDRAFAVMALTPHHTYQVLTKRSARMRGYMSDAGLTGGRATQIAVELMGPLVEGPHSGRLWELQQRLEGKLPSLSSRWPLPNVWLGVSAEDQARADERIPDLLATPAAIRWLSAEPLLGPIDWKRWLPAGRPARRPGTGEAFIAPHFYMTRCEHCGWVGSSELCGVDSFGDDSDVYCPSCESSIMAEDLPRLAWVVAGGESGPGARPMHPDWIRALRDQCAAAGVPFLFKQWGSCAPAEGGAWKRVGKKAAGRLLDGVLHDAFPEPSR